MLKIGGGGGCAGYAIKSVQPSEVKCARHQGNRHRHDGEEWSGELCGAHHSKWIGGGHFSGSFRGSFCVLIRGVRLRSADLVVCGGLQVT